MKIRCPFCGRTGDIPADATAKSARCRKCSKTFLVRDTIVVLPAAGRAVFGGESARSVFISYASGDRSVADTVCSRIEAEGIACWIAPRDVRPGREYAEAIVDAIHHSSVLVLIFSEQSNDSKQVLREVERAASSGKTIMPFRIEECQPTKSLEYFLSTPQWVDAFTGPIESHVEHLAVVLRGMLADKQTPRQLPPAADVLRPVTYSPSILPAWEKKLNDGAMVEVFDCRDEIPMHDLREVLRQTLLSHNVDEFCIQDCEVALVELYRNVSRHATVAIAKCEIALSFKYRRFQLSISSQGPAFTLHDALARYDNLPEDQRTVHGLQNLLSRGALDLSHDGAWNTVKFSTTLEPRCGSGAEKLPLHLTESSVKVGNRVFGYSQWLHAISGSDVAELLLTQWHGERPCRVLVLFEPPKWTLSAEEAAAISAFETFVSSIAVNGSFVLDIPGGMCWH